MDKVETAFETRTGDVSARPLRLAVIGIGGYASQHHQTIIRLETESVMELKAACDINLGKLSEEVELFRFAERDVEVYTDWLEMLDQHAESLDLVDIVAPIQLHAEMHAECVRRGLACYLEKPPTLVPEELESMIAVDRGARYATQVGFNHIYQPFRLEIKKKIVAGSFGQLRRVEFLGLWQRSTKYFGRSSWAGRLQVGGALLLDSCAGNAMAHNLHNLLFFANQNEVMCWAMPLRLEAELYRANPIESTDTIFARGRLDSDVSIRFACTHACSEGMDLVERLVCDQAVIEIREGRDWKIIWNDGGVETGEAPLPNIRENLDIFSRYINHRVDRPMTRLSDSRGFVALNAMLYLAARQIHDIPDNQQEMIPSGECRRSIVVKNIEAAARTHFDQDQLPSEQSLSWACSGGSTNIEALPELKSTVSQMVWDTRT